MDQSPPFEDQLVALLPRLRRFAHALSRNSADADDLTQATIERALRSKAQWQPGTRLDSWCYRIMRNLWIDTARSHRAKRNAEAPEEAERVGDDPRDAMRRVARSQTGDGGDDSDCPTSSARSSR